ncbi:DUF692 domain-containing protein [Gallaecimonas sp. GXIMD4217]|uniref:MNIO family bufferin maturase n=1 Tax=Gallaecimonas sp. GXIMD4217 TaxID=3131927 RepID=UPI00311B2B86
MGTIRGAGIGLRPPHIAELLAGRPPLPWLEVLTDNYLDQGGLNLARLRRLAEHYPLVLHGVGLSLGSVSPLDLGYLKALKALKALVKPAWISDHACFTSLDGHHLHDLLPLPYTEEAVRHLAGRIRQVQDYLGEQILIENVSRYLDYRHSTMGEGDFLAQVAQEADCLLLLDVNNAYVNEVNLGEDSLAFFAALPLARVAEIHLAGYADQGQYLLDAHNSEVAAPVWQRYDRLLAMLAERELAPVPTLIEWDNRIPPLDTLLAQRRLAQRRLDDFEQAEAAP